MRGYCYTTPMSHAHVACIVRKRGGKMMEGELRACIGEDWLYKAFANGTVVRTVKDIVRLGRAYE